MRNRSYGFEIYLGNVKTIWTIAHIFVTFSEKLNFICEKIGEISPQKMVCFLHELNLFVFSNLFLT